MQCNDAEPIAYYSYVEPEDPRQREALRWQLQASIGSLRRQHQSLTVLFFLHGSANAKLLRLLERHDVEPILCVPYPDGLEEVLGARARVLAAYPLLHRWMVFDQIAARRPSQLLYLDCDTLFAGDLVELMHRHAGRHLYAREEPRSARSGRPCTDYLDEALLYKDQDATGFSRVEPFNTGITVMNRGLWTRWSPRLPAFAERVLRYLLWFARNPDPRWDHPGVLRLRGDLAAWRDTDGLRPGFENRWACDQYAVWCTLASIPALSQGYFSPADVLLGTELLESGANRSWSAAHYFSVNTLAIQQWLDS